MDNISIATLDNDIRNRWAEFETFGNFAKMQLTLYSAIAIRFWSLKAFDSESSGPATSISSSEARRWIS